MLQRSYGELVVLQFETIETRRWPIRHAISTRVGGVSAPPHASLNLGFRPADPPAHTIENRRRLCSALGFKADRFVSPSLAHLSNVRIVSELSDTFRIDNSSPLLTGTDALVTALPDIVLFVTSADCSLTLFYDPEHIVLAVIHAGWQGVALDIHANVLRVMQLRFGTNPARLFAGIGPMVSSAAYSVPEERITILTSLYGSRIVQSIAQRTQGVWHLDIRALLLYQLQTSGVTDIECASYTTDGALDYFFSARAEGETGRFALAASLTQ